VLGAPRGRPPTGSGGSIARKPPPAPASRKADIPVLDSEPDEDHDATSVMDRPEIEASLRALEQRPPVSRAPGTQRVGGSGRPPPPVRQAGPSNRVAPESAGAIALPRPPVQAPIGGGTSRAPVSQRPAPGPQGTVRTTSPVRKTASLPPTQSYGSAPPPRSAEPPPLDDLVPRSRSERPRHTRPPVNHRSQPSRPPPPRFGAPDPRPPGGSLPGPDSFGRIPAPIQRYEAKPGEFPSPSNFPPPVNPSNFPPPVSPSNFPPPVGPDATMAMARSPYAAVPQPRNPAEYYPPPQPAPQPRSYAPPPMRDRDPNEYYPHLAQSQPVAPVYDRYPPPGYLAPADPRARTLPASAMSGSVASAYPPALLPQDSRLPVPGSAPYPYVAPPIENPSFMGLVLFAAPLALATLAVAALALM
jgi:hypothetical protein